MLHISNSSHNLSNIPGRGNSSKYCCTLKTCSDEAGGGGGGQKCCTVLDEITKILSNIFQHSVQTRPTCCIRQCWMMLDQHVGFVFKKFLKYRYPKDHTINKTYLCAPLALSCSLSNVFFFCTIEYNFLLSSNCF